MLPPALARFIAAATLATALYGLCPLPVLRAETPIAATAPAQQPKLPQEIPLDHPGIRYIGRFSDDRTFAWTATQIAFNFDGTSAEVDIKGQERPASNNYFRIDVDGVKTAEVNVVKGVHTIRVADNLPPGPHHVRIFRQTEPLWNETQLVALRLDSAGKMLPAPPPAERKLLAIGDSITCGYGNAAAHQDEGFKAEQEKGDLTFAALAAEKLGAEYHCVAWSGRGIYRNRGKGAKPGEGTMPTIFDRILPNRADSPKFDPQSIVPDVITINLNTNDLDQRVPPRRNLSPPIPVS